MRIALLSDVHGNLPALEAVLDDLPDVDRVVCLGDVVGYNPWPAACVDRVREVADTCLQGNHDRVVETPGLYEHNAMAYEGLKLAKNELSATQLTWLWNRPETHTALDGRMLYAHSHPDERDRYVQPDEFGEIRADYLTDGTDLVALGHTHVQGVSEWQDDPTGVVLNPGSVGQPRDEDWRAAYAVVDTDGMSVSQHRVEYDVVRTQQKIHDVGLPERTGRRLGDGR